MSLKTTRRRMLELTAAIPATFFLRDLDARAQGGTTTGPKRFVLLYHAMGSSGQHWYGAGGTETSFQLGYTLSPLEPHKSDIVICREVNNQTACDHWFNAPGYCGTRGGKVDQHSVATCTLLAPSTPRDPNVGYTFPGTETLDWHIGKKLKDKYRLPHDHLYLTPARRHGTGVDGVDVFTSRRNAGGQLEDPYGEDDPVAVYQKYFGAGPGPTAPVGGDPIDADRARRRQVARRLVTDFVASEVGVFQKALPAELRPEVDAHVAELRELERKLTAVPAEGAPRSPDAPTRVLCTTVDPPKPELVKNSTTNYRARAEVYGDLVASAFACGVTSSVTLAWWTFNGRCYPPNVAGTKAYPNLHEGLQHNKFGYTRQDVADCHQHVAHQTARLLQKLKSIPEGGGTMLDNTLLLWISDMGMDPFDGGNTHNKTNLPFVLMGKAGGALKTGRLIDFKKMSHARLLAAITHLMGFPTDAWGEAKYNVGGPAAQLLAR